MHFNYFSSVAWCVLWVQSASHPCDAQLGSLLAESVWLALYRQPHANQDCIAVPVAVR